MGRKKNAVPAYKKHPTKDEARCWIDGKWVSLGKWDSDKSKEAYEQLCEKRRLNPEETPQLTDQLRVEEVVQAFFKFAQGHYRTSNGLPSPGLKGFTPALEPVLLLYGSVPATEFGPLALKVARQWMIDQKWCRTNINRHVHRIRRVFRWATSEELIPPTVIQGLDTVEALKRGRCEAKEMPPVVPVPWKDIEKTKPFLNRHTRAMVELQILTGMRPGEVCRLSLSDIDRSGKIWVWRPSEHKTAHLEHSRIIWFGPRAQKILNAFVAGSGERKPGEALFSPREAREERYRALRAKRKSNVPPSQQNRRKANPKKPALDCYKVTSFANHVARAADLAGVPIWSPGQLRHTAASEIRKLHGLEGAQVILGHRRADVTQIYAERDASLGLKIAAEMG